MNTQNLLEQASLDALGLLDEQERTAFETGFRAAPPAVQAQIRREQARFASSDVFLPRVDTPAGLKFRVLTAVRDAIQSFNRVETARRAEHTPFLRSLMWNSTPLWRAACIGFATATVVLGVFFTVMSTRVKDMATLEAANEALERQRQTPGMGEFILTDFTVHVFEPRVDESRGAEAKIVVSRDLREANLVARGLPVANGTYSLVVVSKVDGSRRVLTRFDTLSTAIPMRLGDFNPESDLEGLAIVGPAVVNGPDVVVMSLT
jgi:hypothetical protein